MSKHVIHFSLGPVQSFVAQARRTRDLWAGSFLLSWLAGQAMAQILRQEGNKIIFPWVGEPGDWQDPLLRAICDVPDSTPSIGSLPNRFKAEVLQDFDPGAITAAVQEKWYELADQVWCKYLADVAPKGCNVRQIWDRQIKGFWDIQWVMGREPEDKSDSGWLDKRKNWRTHWPPIEEGDHCTIMGDWQELSGFTRAGARKKQDAFWNALRKSRGIGRLDLREGERLCSIALVKRLFPRLETALQETIGWVPGGKPDAVGNWPSTSYMAAVPWLLHIAQHEDESYRQELRNYVNAIHDHTGREVFNRLTGERATQLPGLSRLNTTDIKVAGRSPVDMDGNLFLEAGLANPRNTPLSDIPPRSSMDDPDEGPRTHLLKALRKLNKNVAKEARPFFALLLMDGDRLGEKLRVVDPGQISRSLTRFTQEVPQIVEKYNGVTIYAGGDDVLAMLPVSSAVECSLALRRAYLEAFDAISFQDGTEPTVSCAIVFTHCHKALQSTLEQARHQLEDVAKDGNGRNSLALAIQLSGGINSSWVARFKGAPQNLLKLRDWIAAERYSTSFFYNLRTRYGMLSDEFGGDNGLEARDLVLAEYCKGNPTKPSHSWSWEEAAQLVCDICARERGDGTSASAPWQLDGLFIARWLAENSLLEPNPTEAT